MAGVASRKLIVDGTTALRPFVKGDVDELVALRVANRPFTEPYEPRRHPSFYTAAGQAQEIALDERAWAAGTGYAFAVLDRSAGDRIIGRVALANVVRGAWGNATLGYWVDEAARGRGHAAAAVRCVLRFAFGEAGLHRVQPAVMPRNAASRRVVEKAGFRHEGRALRYLEIDGVWEDHDIFAITVEELAT